MSKNCTVVKLISCLVYYNKNVLMSIRILEYLDMQKVSRQSYFYGGKKCKKTLERARMLMRTKVLMHVETCVILSRKNAKNFVKIGVDAEDYYSIKEK